MKQLIRLLILTVIAFLCMLMPFYASAQTYYKSSSQAPGIFLTGADIKLKSNAETYVIFNKLHSGVEYCLVVISEKPISIYSNLDTVIHTINYQHRFISNGDILAVKIVATNKTKLSYSLNYIK